MIVHAFVTAFLLVDMSIGLLAFAMLCIVWSEHAERYMSQQREIANQRANITVLQMRPHFIYNTMTSIYYLCEQDPKMAQQVTLDFTTYLRRNLAAIASDDTIPFLEELEHTRAYLAVEQAQFEDMLLVDYDTPHVDFRVPPLTLQPIVENAVKHGLDPDSAPLHVTIRTRKIGSTSQIVVANNGLGFDPAIADDPHTTIANIRQRLEMMCNGSLVIASCADGGATVTVTIP
jgi:LytS/YehU family sensor histidine kinase